MSKFKVGDRVRVVRGHSVKDCEGRIGTCVESGENHAIYDFGPGFDGWRHESQDAETAWGLDDFEVELVAATRTTPHIVAALRSDGPAPAFHPYVHDSAAAATKEACRLAEANPGTEFAIYARVAGYRADKPAAMEVV